MSIKTFERVSSQISLVIVAPATVPAAPAKCTAIFDCINHQISHLYMNNEKTNVLIGNDRHWRTVNKTLCTFFTTKELLR